MAVVAHFDRPKNAEFHRALAATLPRPRPSRKTAISGALAALSGPFAPTPTISAMFARVSIYENVDLDLADQVTLWLETSETDPFRGLPGYRGSMTLVDRATARIVGIGFYASAAQAQEAEARLTTLYEQSRPQVPEPIRPALEMRPESVGLYEIVRRD
ncbi:MAG TPA: hypothetical protein VFY91_00645 [Microbacterium sp.]|nr:hypothetical protein [Microbacterium sp.]